VPELSTNYTTRLEAHGVPKILWKYSGERGIGLLTGMAIKVTRPNEFNDPFEFSPGVGRAISVRYLRKLYRNNCLITKLGLPALEEIDGTDDAEKLEFVADQLNRGAKEVLSEQLDVLSARYGVICLSGDPRNIGMWSHYAQNHRGFVVGLNHSRVAPMPLLPVVYSDRRALFQGTTILTANNKTNVRVYEVLLRKSPDWVHEQEYRMIWPLDQLEKRQVDGQEWHMLPILPKMIAEVVVGVRASDEFTDNIRNAIASLGTKIRLRKARMHPRKYSLNFEDI